MRNIWYSDNRDLVKWGVLTYIAKENALKTIVQVPYLRTEACKAHFSFRKKNIEIGQDVWGFFRDIQRVEQFGKQAGLNIEVILNPESVNS